MYSGPLAKALRSAYPEVPKSRRGKFIVLEDNDPTGYKSGLGKQAKQGAGILTDYLPRRSPDLNVLDYRIWAEINSRMRTQEKSFTRAKRETQQQYLARLKRTALSLPRSFVEKAVQDMHRRVRDIYGAGGGLIKRD